MQTTKESYHNSQFATNLQNLTNSELDNLYSTVYDSLGEAIDNDDIESHDKILPVLRAIKTEIQNRNKVTSTTTEDKTNIQIIKTQIEQSFKKISRNNLIFKYACFLRTIKKITSKELLLISYINKQKFDSLTRVHTLLVYEHARLYKVAK